MGPQPMLPLISRMCRPSAGSSSSRRAAVRSGGAWNTLRVGMPAGSSVSAAMPQRMNSSASSWWGMTQMSGVQLPTVGEQV